MVARMRCPTGLMRIELRGCAWYGIWRRIECGRDCEEGRSVPRETVGSLEVERAKSLWKRNLGKMGQGAE